MKYKKCLGDALILVNEAQNELSAIRSYYESSISNNEIDSRLLIKIKCTLELLRSALDYTAQGLVLKYSPQNKKKVYFPYATKETDREKFIKEKRIERSLPGLSEARPDLADLILSMQHFSSEGARWFPEFMDLNNKNKHVHLVPHEQFKGVSFVFEGRKIVSEGITIGETGAIETDKGILKGPLNITYENANDFNGYGIFKAEEYDAIYIDGYGYPLNSYEFMNHCVKALSAVVQVIANEVP